MKVDSLRPDFNKKKRYLQFWKEKLFLLNKYPKFLLLYNTNHRSKTCEITEYVQVLQ
jgi:hypothetical protein